jgi:hypothetical protein
MLVVLQSGKGCETALLAATWLAATKWPTAAHHRLVQPPPGPQQLASAQQAVAATQACL